MSNIDTLQKQRKEISELLSNWSADQFELKKIGLTKVADKLDEVAAMLETALEHIEIDIARLDD